MTVNGRPAIIRVAERELAIWLAAIESCTVPLPVPPETLGAIQNGCPLTVHEHPACVVTVTFTMFAPEETAAELVESECVHCDALG